MAEDEIDNITDLMDMNLSKLQETVNDRGATACQGMLQSMASQRVRHDSECTTTVAPWWVKEGKNN